MQDPEFDWTTEDILDCIDGLPPTCEPGAEWHYSNTNTVLLGFIVEAVTGNPLHQEIRRRLLDPLGLDNTFTLWFEDVTGDFAHSYYQSTVESWIDYTNKYNHSFDYACGNMASNARDLLVWIRELVTGSVLQAATIGQMTACVGMGDEAFVTERFWETGYGLGIICANDVNSRSVLGHSGASNTAVSQMWYSPSWDSSVVLFINHGFISEHWKWLQPMVDDVFTILGDYQ